MGALRWVAVVVACACSSSNPYPCTSSSQCVLDGKEGVCEQQGFCSFPDPSCSSGQRFEPNAGGGLAGACVDAVPPCGAVGQACCATDTPCGHNGVCTNNTCQACVLEASPGRNSTCVIRNDHTVWCAGDNEYGELGFGFAGVPMASWMQVRDDTGIVIDDATTLALGWESACAVRGGGSVWCWGLNNRGQLGDNTTTNRYGAVEVQRAAGGTLAGIVQISAGDSFVCGVDSSDGVWCWGANTEGELGDGTIVDRHQAAQVLVAPLGAATTGAMTVTAGKNHACLRKSDNSIWCWGRNQRGQVGDNSIVNRANPVMVASGSSVAAGRTHTCAVKLDGTAWCWGDAWRNRIGNGADTYDLSPGHYAIPTQVLVAPGGSALVGAKSAVAGGVSCVIMQDSSLLCWGDGTHAQTGNGAGTTTPVPVLMDDGKPITGVASVVETHARGCAQRSDGSIWCWGQNLYGGFGDGTFENHALATPLRFTCP